MMMGGLNVGGKKGKICNRELVKLYELAYNYK